MTDTELFGLAAKAAGIKHDKGDYAKGLNTESGWWNPLEDDGDALRLAVKLNLLVDCFGLCVRPLPDSLGWFEGSPETDSNAAIRRAIVRAAAEIGRAIP